jgi:hypothetical protein
MATNKYIIQLIVETGSGQAKVKGVEKAFKDLDVQVGKAENSIKKTNQAMKNTAGSAGIAGAATAEFGRLISDMPYGLQAITNNMSQLGSMFALLVSSAGSTKAAFQAMLQTLIGPAGWLIAFQVAIASLEYFSRGLKSADTALEKMTKAQGAAASELKTVRDLLSRQIGSYEETADMIDRVNEEYDELNLNLDKSGNLTRESKRALDDLINSYEEAARAKAVLSVIEDMYQRRVVKEAKLLALRTEEVNLFTNSMQYLQDLMAGAFISPQLGRASLIAGVESDLGILEGKISDIINLVGDEGLVGQIFGPTAFGKSDDKAKRSFFPFLTDDQLKKLEEQHKETADKERERREKLLEIDKEYSDGVVELMDETGLVKLMHQERDAMAEAKALGASKETLLRIEKFYQQARQDLLDKAEEKSAEKKSKEDKKKAKEDEKKRKDALEKNKKTLEDFFDSEIKAMKSKVDVMTEVFSKFGDVIQELDTISQASFQRQINSLREQRDLVRTNDLLTKEEKEKQLTDIQRKENQLQRQRIKSERDMFTLKQTVLLAEMVLKQKAFVQEQIMMAQLQVALAKFAMSDIQISAAKQTGKAGMSIGAFMETLGPWGIAAFALSIGGVIASIVSARKKASAEIAGLSDAPISLGGGSSSASVPSGPAFNLIGTGGQSQLAQAISSQQQAPVRAYVVAGEVTTAQSMERNRVREASI